MDHNPKIVVHNPRMENSPYKDIELKENETAARIVEAGEKIYTLKCSDPHGMWTVHGKGKVPKQLSGSYLTAFDAQRAIESYLSTLKATGAINKKHRESLGLN